MRGLTAKKSASLKLIRYHVKYYCQVNIGGNAQNAGLEAGDVILRLSGTFDEVVDVAGLGINKIKSLVAGRSEDRLVCMLHHLRTKCSNKILM
jgi:hypothetical protein